MKPAKSPFLYRPLSSYGLALLTLLTFGCSSGAAISSEHAPSSVVQANISAAEFCAAWNQTQQVQGAAAEPSAVAPSEAAVPVEAVAPVEPVERPAVTPAPQVAPAPLASPSVPAPSASPSPTPSPRLKGGRKQRVDL